MDTTGVAGGGQRAGSGNQTGKRRLPHSLTKHHTMAHAEIRRHIRKLSSVFEGSPWYGPSVWRVLQEIDAEKVFLRPLPDAHCIAELVAHMLAWREVLLRRLHGDNAFSMSQDKSFDWRLVELDPQRAWPALLQALEDQQRAIVEALEAADDDLLSTVVPGKSYNYRTLIQGIIHHDIYHAGQIILLGKATVS